MIQIIATGHAGANGHSDIGRDDPESILLKQIVFIQEKFLWTHNHERKIRTLKR